MLGMKNIYRVGCRSDEKKNRYASGVSDVFFFFFCVLRGRWRGWLCPGVASTPGGLLPPSHFPFLFFFSLVLEGITLGLSCSIFSLSFLSFFFTLTIKIFRGVKKLRVNWTIVPERNVTRAGNKKLPDDRILNIYMCTNFTRDFKFKNLFYEFKGLKKNFICCLKN